MSQYCQECGASISHRGSAAKFCENCAKKQNTLYHNTYKAKTGHYIGNVERLHDKRCEDCGFFNEYGGYCDYATIMRRTRLALHRGETHINDPCKEITPRKKKTRRGRRNAMDRGIGEGGC